MEDNEFSAPPMSGEDQVPFREMVAEQVEPEPGKEPAAADKPPVKKDRIFLFGLIGALVIIVILVIVLIVVFVQPQESAPPPEPSPSPSPVAEATASGLPRNIGERRENLEKQLRNLDLEEINLSFPIIDFEIEF